MLESVPGSPATERLDATRPADVLRAAMLLRSGGTVAFPTETVYGLGADALEPAAVKKIFAAKQRPQWDPLIVHVADLADAIRVGTFSPAAQLLAESFWPGPLTLLVPRASQVPDLVTAGRPLVGVRVPAHPVARALLAQAGIPVAAPSANRFGHTSPVTAAHVLADLDGRIDAVLDGGASSIGLESTVVELRPFEAIVYRPGAVTLANLEQVLGPEFHVHLHHPVPTPGEPASLPSPGVGIRHYAPRARLILVEDLGRSRAPLELTLETAIDEAQHADENVGVLLPAGWSRGSAQHVFPWGPWGDAQQLAARLYLGLRTLDDTGVSTIVCPLPEQDGLGDALRDRLHKAARTS